MFEIDEWLGIGNAVQRSLAEATRHSPDVGHHWRDGQEAFLWGMAEQSIRPVYRGMLLAIKAAAGSNSQRYRDGIDRLFQSLERSELPAKAFLHLLDAATSDNEARQEALEALIDYCEQNGDQEAKELALNGEWNPANYELYIKRRAEGHSAEEAIDLLMSDLCGDDHDYMELIGDDPYHTAHYAANPLKPSAVRPPSVRPAPRPNPAIPLRPRPGAKLEPAMPSAASQPPGMPRPGSLRPRPEAHIPSPATSRREAFFAGFIN